MKYLKRTLLALAVLILLFLFAGLPYFRAQTKKFSPERNAAYEGNGMDLTVHYCAPFKKGRVIFGELVPFGKVWRTGANEPTTLTTMSDIEIVDKPLPKGTYSLWTIPGPDHWKVILNRTVPSWGVSILSGGNETTRDPEADVVNLEIPVTRLPDTAEQFSITFDGASPVNLVLTWDQTQVKVPIYP